MTITVALRFNAQVNSKDEEAPPLGVTETETTWAATEAADDLERILAAVRERRLYSFMVAEAAVSHMAVGSWLGLTVKEVLAEARANSGRDNRGPRLPGVSKVQRED
ncbi:hypothetical protein H8A99_04080 [Bradyrhizobium sp. Arg68]|uniref:hypothetical protein n=1 Tax=Bradyrhizobium ivorense TaxID=2511166 RepID=UPI001E6457CA|nr:hypothetical protein [Bradyrhizobium ivorense]MCC8935696.1 hypothetical protein [Bradyrhizobium ivorense]